VSRVAPYRVLDQETVYTGRLVEVQQHRVLHGDGEEVMREVIHQQDAVAVVAHDSEHVWLVRQPREAVREQSLLEIPAGRLDRPGEAPLAAAQRELAEETGRGARSWEHILSYYASPGLSDERIHLFLACDLHEAPAATGEIERIEVVPWPLTALARAIDECADGKTLVGLLWLARRLCA
jgi:ADP-ribose pyrophosphatase